MSSRSGIRPSLAFTPTAGARPLVASSPVNPPGALVPGQRAVRALNSAQFAAAQQARAAGVAAGLSGRALEVSVRPSGHACPINYIKLFSPILS